VCVPVPPLADNRVDCRPPTVRPNKSNVTGTLCHGDSLSLNVSYYCTISIQALCRHVCGRPSAQCTPGAHSTAPSVAFCARFQFRFFSLMVYTLRCSVGLYVACASISLHGWGDTQWLINPPPLLSSSHSPSSPPPERCKVSQQVWNRVMN